MSLSPAAADLVRREFGGDTGVEPLPGDASDRRYFRLRPAAGPPRILLVQSDAFDPPYVIFERMAAFLLDNGFPVPRILSRHPEARAFVLEDLGDRTLQAHLRSPAGADAAERRVLYEEAVDWIVGLQRRGTPAVGPDIPAYHFALDDVKLGRELDYFREHYVGRLLDDPTAADPEASGALRRDLAALAALAGRSGDRVLCHRDYHSRNLMLREPAGAAGGRLAMVDFQDARLGPRAYDLASLLCDAYVEVPEDLAGAMIERFLAGLGRRLERAAFAADYAAVAAQRTLKAAGTFAGQATRFGVTRYLDDIPRALGHARRSLGGLPALDSLRRLLDGPLAYRGQRPA